MDEVEKITQSPVVLWWGRSDRDYSRNAIIRQCFRQLGWDICDFHPWLSRLGHTQARLSQLAKADLIWVPCFRQRDIAAARDYALATSTPLCIDPLISAYDKQVDERAKFSPQSASAQRLLRWEQGLFTSAQRVVADTHEHANFFATQLAVDPKRIVVIPVGADETLFKYSPPEEFDGQLRVLFYGSFLALQGPQFIVQAAQQLQSDNVEITLLGDGPLHQQCVDMAQTSPRVRFEPWLHYQQLPLRIARADVLLGAFGTTPKAARVIPNKVYQALASGRAVITRSANAYPQELMQHAGAGLRFVPAGHPQALASVIDEFALDPNKICLGAESARQIYQQYFSASRVRQALADMLRSLGLVDDRQHHNN